MPQKYRKTTGFFFDNYILINGEISEEQFYERIKKIMQKHPGLRCTYNKNEKNHGNFRINNDIEKQDGLYTYVNIEEKKEISKPTDAQIKFIKNYYHELDIKRENMVDCMPICFICFKLCNSLYAVIIMSNHVVIDGWSMWSLCDEIASDSVDDIIDKFDECNEIKKNELEAKQQMLSYWVKRLANIEINCLPLWVNIYGDKSKQLEVKIANNDIKRMKEYCNANGFSLVSYIVYTYANNLLHAKKSDMIIFDQLISGRSNFDKKWHHTIGNYFNVLPCVLHSGETCKDFYENCKKDRKNGSIAIEEIWEAKYGRYMYMPINKGITSEIFPFTLNKRILDIKTSLINGLGNLMYMKGKDLYINFSYVDTMQTNELMNSIIQRFSIDLYKNI